MLEDRFNSLGRFLKNTFGERVHRMNVNIPGKVFGPGETPTGYALCPGGSLTAPIAQEQILSVEDQIEKAKGRIRKKFNIGKYIVHFHSPSNEYVDLEKIEETVEKVMQDNEIIGLNFTVRLDCIDEKITRFLAKTSEYIYLWLETGVHTMHDATLQKLGVNFTRKDIREKILRLKEKNIRISTHVVLGLPGETREMMKETMIEISRLPVSGVNMHHFFIHEESPFAEEYRNGTIDIISMEEYVSLACDFIETLPPNVVLRRIVGETARDKLVAPDWTLRKRDTIMAIPKELERRDSMQGFPGFGLNPIIVPEKPAEDFPEADDEDDIGDISDYDEVSPDELPVP